MEIWDILDENGNFTGKTMQSDDERVWQKGIYHQGVDIWIINNENKILIQKRSKEKKRQPNVWAMTGGSVIKGESSVEAIKRETLEELGIEINTEKLIKIKRIKTRNTWIDEYIIRQDVDINKITIQKEEVSDVKFASFEEIEEIYKNNMFMRDRWENVREKIKKILYCIG